jgi:hypothetical protein
MASYTLHLGFNWNSPIIGSTWGDGSTSGEYRFLQYALARQDGAPAWFQFVKNDVLSVTIWDLSSAPSLKDLALSMSFSALEAGEVSTYAPGTLVTSGDARSLTAGNGDPYLSFDSVTGVVGAGGSGGPWGASSFVYAAGSFTFAADASYKLSFLLRAAQARSDGSPARLFVSDPEVIVGSRGG